MKERQIPLNIWQATWGKVKNMKYDVVILPWGAIEPHNYHLPYLTDPILAYEISCESANRACEKSGVHTMVLPPIYLGSQNPGQWNLPFCIHARSETRNAILSDIVESLYVQGFRKLVIVNGHGGNTFKGLIRDLAMKHPDFFIVSLNWFDIVATDNYFEEKPDDHAGEQETSVMLHYHPELVDMETAGDGKTSPWEIEALNRKIGWAPRHWQKASEDTGIGNPYKSTAEKGKKYVAEVVDKISDLLVDLCG